MAQDYVKGLLSTGEIVLIDTRQHWMALIRFALKPILILVLAGLLVLVNQWLDFDGFVGILNDLIHVILIVLFLAVIVWLPIDIVRWYSRHFVLTNRRSMRMDGVFRKQSHDASLEQINDIAFLQTVFGRALGYSDLTLITASDSPNETYAQLRDGLQYKKAVLDAKEGIRIGAPLKELAPDFIVRGGTNIASMRADGRLEQAAALEEKTRGPSIGTDQTSQEFEPVTGEVLAQRSDPGSSRVAAPKSSPPATPDAAASGVAGDAGTFAEAEAQAAREAAADEEAAKATPVTTASTDQGWPSTDQAATPAPEAEPAPDAEPAGDDAEAAEKDGPTAV